MTLVHHYHNTTREFLNSSQARQDPVDGNDVLPADATFDAPPSASVNTVATWGGANWVFEADFRGTEYWMPDGSRHLITAIGEVVPPEGLDAPPAPSVQEVTDAFIEEVRREIERRVYAEVSLNTQINMGGESAAGLFDATQQAAFISGLNWIKAMRATALALAQAGDQSFADDAHWPPVPPEAKALADSF